MDGAQLDVPVATESQAAASFLRHEEVLEELQMVKSKLESGDYGVFPAGSGITKTAIAAIHEDIDHQKVHENLVLKLDLAKVTLKEDKAKQLVLDAITNEFDTDEFKQEGHGDAIDELDDLADLAKPRFESGWGNGEAYFSKVLTTG